jgi:acetyltransferase
MDTDQQAGKLKPFSNIIRYEGRRTLDPIFKPQSVAVIGATEKPGSVGRTLLWNLIQSPFGGTVFPVNPKRDSILGIKAYPSLSDVPGRVDLAVIVTPAASAPGLIRECAQRNVPGAIVISAGFKEAGEEGIRYERQVVEEARRGRVRVIGPNCLGVMSPLTGLNATFASAMARPGNVGFLSQSGALCTAVLDWSLEAHVGFSAFVSIGSMADVGWGDLIDYLGDDPQTRSIVIYMESIGDARSFLSAAREVALTKPIVVIKAGRTSAAAKAAASHTGALTGSDEVLDAAFRRSGVLRVDDIAELFAMADVLSKQPRPRGPRLTILTNAGGPGVLACDALISNGGELTALSPEAIAAYNELLPKHWSHNNPVDILGDAEPERYAKALEIAAKDANSDGMLVILTPQAMTDPTRTAEALKAHATLDKPVLASWMGGTDVAAGAAILNRSNIPSFAYPDIAAKIFTDMWRYTYNLRGIYETPTLAGSPEDSSARQNVEAVVQHVRKAGRTLLTEYESKQVLAAYGIPTVETRIAKTADEAVAAAAAIGFPVVLKLHSETITHKTDVGGVRLNLATEGEVRKAFGEIDRSVGANAGAGHFGGVTVQPMIRAQGYEIIIGSSLDPQFGPVLLVGSGGQLVEVYKDRALALPPLTTTLARRMLEQTRIYRALKGVRGRKAVDLDALEGLLVRFSQLVVEQKWIKEIDINPLIAGPEQLLALDARVVVHEPKVSEAELPQVAIRPYPTKYVSQYRTKSGLDVTVRPIRPEDEPLLVKFHETLSERSIYLRYLQALKLSQRVAHERLARVCFIDYDREMALVAELVDPATHDRQVVGVARLAKIHGTSAGEFALLVADQYQRQGLGTELLKRLTQVARDEKLSELTGNILPENTDMVQLCRRTGFVCDYSEKDETYKAQIRLENAGA